MKNFKVAVILRVFYQLPLRPNGCILNRPFPLSSKSSVIWTLHHPNLYSPKHYDPNLDLSYYPGAYYKILTNPNNSYRNDILPLNHHWFVSNSAFNPCIVIGRFLSIQNVPKHAFNPIKMEKRYFLRKTQKILLTN